MPGAKAFSASSRDAPARAPRVQIDVRVPPGITVFTRIPRPTSSAANTRAIAVTPPFDAAYAADPGAPNCRITEPLSTIEPPLRISGTAACTVRNTPVRLVRVMASNAAAVVLPSGDGPPMPAFANTMSSEPNCFSTVFATCSIAAGSSRSALIAIAFGPSSVTASSSFLLSRPVIATRAPCSTSIFAVANPMPLLPPVMSAVLFSNLMTFSVD